MNFFQSIKSVFNRGNDSPKKKRSRGQKFHAPQRGAPVLARGYFAAADNGRFSKTWSASHLPIDRAITQDWETISARAQEAVLNNAHAASFAKMARDNIAGPNGFILQPQITDENGKPDKAANTAIFDAWEKWSSPQNASVSGRDSFAELCALAVSSWTVYGEAVFLIRRGANASPWGFAIQSIDPRRIWIGLNTELRDGRFIKNGIEFDALGRPVAYHFRKPLSQVESGTFTFSDCDRGPAADEVHVFRRDLPGQVRGISPLATVLSDIHHADNLERSMLTRANIASNMLGFGSNADSDPASAFTERDSEAGTLIDLGNKEFMQSGIDYPDSSYDVFQKAILRRIASGLGVSYNNLASDLTAVNFSSIRQGLLNERTAWEGLQMTFISQFAVPVFRAWLEWSLLSGKILSANGNALPAAKLEKFSSVKFVGRRWTWIDPVSDMTAAEKALAMKIKSRSKIIRELGGDPWTEWSEISEENAEMEALGLDAQFVPAGATNVNTPAKAQEKAEG
ncbi:MAG: phage portal protein [Opitutales bacterium]|nr:phage portal protein [Opitutales bacterium]